MESILSMETGRRCPKLLSGFIGEFPMFQQALALVFAGAKHEVTDSFAGIFAFVEYELHLFGDGHLDVMQAGETESGARGADAFSNFAAQAIKDFGKVAAMAQCLADGPVAAERAGAGEDKIAGAGEAGKSFAAAAAGSRRVE